MVKGLSFVNRAVYVFISFLYFFRQKIYIHFLFPSSTLHKLDSLFLTVYSRWRV